MRGVSGIVRVMHPLSRVDILVVVTSFSSVVYIGSGLQGDPSMRDRELYFPVADNRREIVVYVISTAVHRINFLSSGKEATSNLTEDEVGLVARIIISD